MKPRSLVAPFRRNMFFPPSGYESNSPLQYRYVSAESYRRSYFTSSWVLLGVMTGAQHEKVCGSSMTCSGKAVPLQAWSVPGCSRKLRLPDFMTTQDGGKVVSLMHRPLLTPKKCS